MKTDLYEEVTNRIIALLENGVVPWQARCMSREGLPRNYSTKKEYRGINVFLLGCLGFTSPDFMTFIQAKELGGHVRKGEKGFLVVKYGTYGASPKESETAAETAGQSSEPEIRKFLKAYTVFHVSQIDGIEFPADVMPEELPLTEKTARARQIIAEMPNPPVFETGGSIPCYCPPTDTIRMPERRFFRGEEQYFATMFHEAAHATGAAHRLARKSLLENKGFRAAGDTSRKIYAEEELVAEMASAFLCVRAGILEDELANSAAYLQGWIDALKTKDAKSWLIRAASQAQKARITF